ncbi:MAG TPA: TonB-dependent receptor [Rhodocyclaceae bacterium]|nr:TonB-dependent receptor [Rhodocyclaceae bacterium]
MPTHLTARPIVLHIAILLGATDLAAAPPSDAELMRLLPLSLEELISTPIVTASRRVEARDHTPAHVMVVTRQQIRERRYRNLAELLEDMPGVDFMRGTKSSSYNNFSFQGHNSNNKLLIMLDGVRIDHPAGGKIPVAENFPLFHARQVEVLYGPAAALYGADAVAGVINIITDRAADAQGAWASVGAGRFDSRNVEFMAGARNADKLAITVGGHAQDSNRAPLDRYYPDDFPRVDARTFGGELVIPAAARESYTGETASHSVYARVDVGDRLVFGHYQNFFRQLTSTGDRPDTALFLSDARWETRIETTYARLDFDLGPSVGAELLVDYSEQEVDPRSRYVNIYTNFGDNGYDYSRATRLGVEQTLNWTIDTRHSMQAGVGYHDYYALETPDLPQRFDTRRGPGNQGLTFVNTTLPIQIFEADYHNVHGYAQFQSDWSDTITTMAGVRYDDHSSYGDSTNPRLGVVWRPQVEHVFKLLYGEAFRAPSPDESLSAFGTFTGETDASGNYLGSGFRVPNANLAPETSKTLSFTWDWRPRQNLNLIANVYRSRVSNLIATLDETTPTQYIPGAILSETTIKGNAGRESHTGADLIGQWRFKLGRQWSGDVWGSLSFIDGDIREGSETRDWDLSYIASRKARLGATFRYLDRFTVTPRLIWSGEATTGRKDRTKPGARIETPSYALASLHLGWHKLADGNLSLWLDVDNLLDRRYRVAHGSAGTTFVSMPQQPRTWMATVEYRF